MPIEGRVTFDRGGAVVGAHPMPQLATSWDMLYRRLRGGLPEGVYRQGRALVRVEALAGSAVAEFADGERAEGDLLIGCDGVRSTVRAQLAPEARARYAGYVAWRGMIPEGAASAAARERLGRRLSFCLPPGEQFLCYPVAGEGGQLDPGDRRLNWVWYRPALEASDFAELFTGTDGARRDVSMPPDSVRPEVTADMRAAARRLLPDFHFELVALTAKPFLQAIYDLDPPEIAFGAPSSWGTPPSSHGPTPASASPRRWGTPLLSPRPWPPMRAISTPGSPPGARSASTTGAPSSPAGAAWAGFSTWAATACASTPSANSATCRRR